MNSKNLLIIAALSGFTLVSATAEEGKSVATKAAKVESSEATGQCAGVNSCKGTSACHSEANSCAGTNSCKGKGWIKTSEKECKAKKGTFTKA